MKILKSLLAITSATIMAITSLGAQTFVPVLPRIIVSDKESPVQLHDLNIEIVVAGNTAVTLYRMTFYNPNRRVLEGTMELPLSQDESVTDYALEVDGRMRHGVVVAKAKARQTYEAVVNRQVDPGLMEKTAGNNYRTRIYPIPSKGYKQVEVTTIQTLASQRGTLLYTMPFVTEEKIASFSIKAEVLKNLLPPTVSSSPYTNFTFNRVSENWKAEFAATKYSLKEPLRMEMAAENNIPKVFVEEDKQGAFFAATTLTSLDGKSSKTRAKNNLLTMVWDVSLSGVKRDLQREKEFAKLLAQNCRKVRLVTFSNQIVDQTEFEIYNGNTDALTQRLESLTYDGATDMSVTEGIEGERIVLFSDGISSLGEKISHSLPNSTAIISSAGADTETLGMLTSNMVNITRLTNSQAIEAVDNGSLHIGAIKVLSGSVDELCPAVGTAVESVTVLTGRLLSDKAEIEVTFDIDGKTVATRTIEIQKAATQLPVAFNGTVSRLWAMQKIEQLTRRGSEQNRTQITELATKHGIVTDFTSLLVLDDIEDYVRYGITPPEEMQDDSYFELLKANQAASEGETTETADQIIERDYKEYYQPLKQWWATNYPTIEMKPDTTRPIRFRDQPRPSRGIDSLDIEQREGAEDVAVTAYGMPNPNRAMLTGRVANIETEYDFAAFDQGDNQESESTGEAAIAMQAWDPDEPYLKILEPLSGDKLYETYLTIRSGYDSSPAFFIDVADLLRKRGDTEHSVRILSNIVEISVCNSEMVKNYAQKLTEYQMYPAAVEAFAYCASLREEHPQSYRDLALAYEQNGDYQKALEIYIKLFTTRWTRFDNIKYVLFPEFNSFIARHSKELDLKSVDNRLLADMSVKMRVAISWGTDNCDIDLHVVEPNKEVCMFSHRNTRNGGHLSFDFTDGFGPEAYMIRGTFEGDYIVQVHYYGTRSQAQLMPVTVYADLFTDYGTKREKRERITFRLTDKKELITIGTITVGE